MTGVPADQVKRVAKTIAELRPGTLIWCMGLTQSSIGSNKVRAACIVQLALGNIGKAGGGANIFRGHDNVQGATDIGPNSDTLPGYYGLSAGAWQHWAGVWGVDYKWLLSRFASKELMEREGITISRWHDGVLEEQGNIAQPHPLRAMIYWGHSPNSQSRGPDLKKAMEKLELLVVIDPVPTATAVIGERRDGTYMLPAGSTMECAGSVTNSQRALQWREKVIAPIFEAKSDYEIAYLLAKKLGFGDELVKNIQVVDNEPVAEDILREVNRGSWSIGYTGQSPERLKLHMQHQDKFDTTSCIGVSEPVKGEYYGLPWPCWGTPELKHPGTPLLYDESKPLAQGGLSFRAAWGLEHDGIPLLADKTAPVGSAVQDGYPEFSYATLEKLGWAGELTAREREAITEVARSVLASHDKPDGPAKDAAGKPPGEFNTLAPPEKQRSTEGQKAQDQRGEPSSTGEPKGAVTSEEAQKAGAGGELPPDLKEQMAKVNWKTDLSGGIIRVAIAHGMAPFGNGKARCLVWNYPDPVPKHREPLYTARRDLLPKYETFKDRKLWRLPQLYASIQAKDFSAEYPFSPHLRPPSSSSRAAATRRGPTSGWPSCSRTCLPRSIRTTPSVPASATGRWCGWRRPRARRVRVMALVHQARRRRHGVHAVSTSRAGGWARTSPAAIRRARCPMSPASPQTRPPPTATTRSPPCRRPRPRSAASRRPRGACPWRA